MSMCGHRPWRGEVGSLACTEPAEHTGMHRSGRYSWWNMPRGEKGKTEEIRAKNSNSTEAE